MVGLGRLRQVNSSRDFGSKGNDIVIVRPLSPSEAGVTEAGVKPRVLRNFSYPTNVSYRCEGPTYPGCSLPEKIDGERFGQPSTLPPDGTPQDEAIDLRIQDRQTPNHKHSGTPGQESSPTAQARPSGNPSHPTPSKADTKSRGKPHRRRALTTLPVSQQNNVPWFSGSSHAGAPGDTKTTTNPRKGTSQGHHKVVQSFDVSHHISFQSTALARPASSSGATFVDSRLEHSGSSADYTLFPIHKFPSAGPQPGQITNMDTSRFRRVSPTAPVQHSTESHGQRNHSSAESSIRPKSGKERWLSQFKDWISMSEPSSQALKDYKKETYRRAGIAPDDPRAPAKLHLPVATLPAEAIKPSGRGPDPEEIILKKVEMKKKMRNSFRMFGSTRPGSTRSSASQRSSFSSLHLGD